MVAILIFLFTIFCLFYFPNTASAILLTGLPTQENNIPIRTRVQWKPVSHLEPARLCQCLAHKCCAGCSSGPRFGAVEWRPVILKFRQSKILNLHSFNAGLGERRIRRIQVILSVRVVQYIIRKRNGLRKAAVYLKVGR